MILESHHVGTRSRDARNPHGGAVALKDFAEGLTQAARTKNKGNSRLTFHTLYSEDVDNIRVPDVFRPDYLILSNMLEYCEDIWTLFENLRPVIHEGTLVIITTNNRLRS